MKEAVDIATIAAAVIGAVAVVVSLLAWLRPRAPKETGGAAPSPQKPTTARVAKALNTEELSVTLSSAASYRAGALYVGSPQLVVEATNTGPSPITVKFVSLEIASGKFASWPEAYCSEMLPRVLQRRESVKCFFPIDGLRSVLGKEALGNNVFLLGVARSASDKTFKSRSLEFDVRS